MWLLRFFLTLTGAVTLLFSGVLWIARLQAPTSLIGFTSARDGNYEVYAITPEGRHLQRLTDDPDNNYGFRWNLRWLFYTSTPFGGYTNLYRTALGSHERQLIAGDVMFIGALSPNDRWLLFMPDKGAATHLYRVGMDGNAPQLLASNSRSQASWSPDGQRIVYAGADWRGTIDLYTMQADGRDQHLFLAHEGIESQVAWSPDGQWIAFVTAAYAEQYGAQLHVVRADGTQAQQITRNSDDTISLSSLTWSPDSQWIAFELYQQQDYDLYRVRRDGQDFQQLTDFRGYDTSPAWSPDGRWIAFAAHRAGNDGDIYTMKPDGSDIRRLTTHPSADTYPLWSPIVDQPWRVGLTLLLGAVLGIVGIRR